jgi:hypothetical protein
MGPLFAMVAVRKQHSSRDRAKISAARRKGQNHRRRSLCYVEEILVFPTPSTESAADRSRRLLSDSLPRRESVGPSLFKKLGMPVRNINHIEKGHPLFAFHVVHGNLKEGCPVRLFRFFQKLHVHFLRRASPFLMVAL